MIVEIVSAVIVVTSVAVMIGSVVISDWIVESYK